MKKPYLVGFYPRTYTFRLSDEQFKHMKSRGNPAAFLRDLIDLDGRGVTNEQQ